MSLQAYKHTFAPTKFTIPQLAIDFEFLTGPNLYS